MHVCQGFPTRVVSLQAEDDVIHVGDAARSVHVVRYSGRPTTPTDVPLILVAGTAHVFVHTCLYCLHYLACILAYMLACTLHAYTHTYMHTH